MATCDPHLDADIAHWKPQVLVPIGAHALSACLRRFLPGDSRSITELHAQPVALPLPKRAKQPAIMLPMRHPSRGSDAEFDAWVAAMQSLLESRHYGN
jgi:uracil-DNA glycosylase